MKKILNTSEFIEKANILYANKYDYSKVEYKNLETKVCIICPEHGEFWQTPKNHLKGHGCVKCGQKKALLEKQYKNKILDKFRNIHGNKYDYSKVEYIDAKTKVCIICPEHGEFWQTPNTHLSNHGCPKCNNAWNKRTRLTSAFYIKKFTEKYGNKYDYSKVVFKNSKEKITIICPKHGEFEILPHNFLYRGCPHCNKEVYFMLNKEKNNAIKILKKRKKQKEKIKKQIENTKKRESEIIEKFKQIHGDKYDYSKVKYINTNTKVLIICPEHGEFEQLISNHLAGKGCKKCSHISTSLKNKSNTKEFIEKSQKIHGEKYNYNKVNYVNAKSKVCIICPEHGEFWQAPYNHLLMNGCPVCGRGKISKEYILKNKLQDYFKDITIVSEKKFKWLGKQRIDIFFENFNIGIEYQGKQHFEPVAIFGGEKKFIKQRKNDIKKNILCEKNNVKIFYFSYDIFNKPFPFEVINDFEKLIIKIEEYIKENE